MKRLYSKGGNTLKIRLGEIEDFKAIKELYLELFTDMATLQPTQYTPAYQDSNFIKTSIMSNKIDFIVVENSDNVVGFAHICERETAISDCIIKHKYVYLMNFIITKEFRNLGFGTKLFNAVKEWGRKRNLEYIELNVLAENIPGIRFYERHNMRESMKTMIGIL